MTHQRLLRIAAAAILVLWIVGIAATAPAADVPQTVGPVGHFDFDLLPNQSPQAWNLDNYEYPTGGGADRRPRRRQPGHADRPGRRLADRPLHDHAAGEHPRLGPFATRRVAHGERPPCRPVQRRGLPVPCRAPAAAVWSTSATAGCKVWQRKGDRDAMVDDTARRPRRPRRQVGRRRSLHTYALQWKSAERPGTMPFRAVGRRQARLRASSATSGPASSTRRWRSASSGVPARG